MYGLLQALKDIVISFDHANSLEQSQYDFKTIIDRLHINCNLEKGEVEVSFKCR